MSGEYYCTNKGECRVDHHINNADTHLSNRNVSIQ